MLMFVLDTNNKISISIIRNKILNLFNMNIKFVSLFQRHYYPHILENECCLSELEYLYCDSEINSNILE
jgi:hypothetical protein